MDVERSRAPKQPAPVSPDGAAAVRRHAVDGSDNEVPGDGRPDGARRMLALCRAMDRLLWQQIAQAKAKENGNE